MLCMYQKQKEITIVDTNFNYFSIEVKLEEIGCLRENWPLSLSLFQREYFRKVWWSKYGMGRVIENDHTSVMQSEPVKTRPFELLVAYDATTEL